MGCQESKQRAPTQEELDLRNLTPRELTELFDGCPYTHQDQQQDQRQLEQMPPMVTPPRRRTSSQNVFKTGLGVSYTSTDRGPSPPNPGRMTGVPASASPGCGVASPPATEFSVGDYGAAPTPGLTSPPLLASPLANPNDAEWATVG